MTGPDSGPDLIPRSFAEVAAMIDNLWKDEFDRAREAMYAESWRRAGFTPAELGEAVWAISTRPGGAWSPSVQEIAAEVRAQRFVGTTAWARDRVRALLRALSKDPRFFDHLDGEGVALYPGPANRGVARGRHINRRLAAEHPVYGPVLADVLANTPLAYLTDDRWWQHTGDHAYDQAVQRLAETGGSVVALPAPTVQGVRRAG